MCSRSHLQVSSYGLVKRNTRLRFSPARSTDQSPDHLAFVKSRTKSGGGGECTSCKKSEAPNQITSRPAYSTPTEVGLLMVTCFYTSLNGSFVDPAPVVELKDLWVAVDDVQDVVSRMLPTISQHVSGLKARIYRIRKVNLHSAYLFLWSQSVHAFP